MKNKIVLSAFFVSFIAVFGLSVHGFSQVDGPDYDAGLCISRGYVDIAGPSYDFIGSIGCPIGDDDQELGIDDPDLDGPHCEDIEVEDIKVKKFKKKYVERFRSGQAILIKLKVDASQCPTMNLNMFLKSRPPSSWHYDFKCDTDSKGACGFSGRTLRIDNINGEKVVWMRIVTPTYASPGAYDLRVGSRRVR